jgi:hypothetical protein
MKRCYRNSQLHLQPKTLDQANHYCAQQSPPEYQKHLKHLGIQLGQLGG